MQPDKWVYLTNYNDFLILAKRCSWLDKTEVLDELAANVDNDDVPEWVLLRYQNSDSGREVAFRFVYQGQPANQAVERHYFELSNFYE